MGNFLDLTGETFGRLVVVATEGKNRWGNYRWLCRCECGGMIVVESNNLRRGMTTSCGCYQAERAREASLVHDATGSPEYVSWQRIKQRCLDPYNPSYPRYGGRGITMCDRWRDSFEAFLADMGPRPTPGHTVERIDNALSYFPDNCRWADRTEQARNTRRNRLITHDGRTMTLAEWSQITGINRRTIAARLDRGMSTAEALGLPV